MLTLEPYEAFNIERVGWTTHQASALFIKIINTQGAILKCDKRRNYRTRLEACLLKDQEERWLEIDSFFYKKYHFKSIGPCSELT